MQLVGLGWATPPSRWRSCSRENFIASTARHRVLPDFVMQATWSHLISKWSMGTRGGMRKGCTAIPSTWTHYYGMDKRTAPGSHHAVRITRNPMDPSKLRWDQFYQFKNRFNCGKYTVTLFLTWVNACPQSYYLQNNCRKQFNIFASNFEQK